MAKRLLKKRTLKTTTQRKRFMKKVHTKVVQRRKNYASQQMDGLLPV